MHGESRSIMAAIKKAESAKASKGKASKPATAPAEKSYTVDMPYLQESKGGNYAVFSATRDKAALAVGACISQCPNFRKIPGRIR